MEGNMNLNNFATELTKLVGQNISLEHVHPSNEGRYYYIQGPKVGAPMLLHHYRGPFFIDIHPDDFEDIVSGKIDPLDYIRMANWQIGYYWGGGSMVTGGYYQPFDIVGRKDEVRRYFQILSCRGKRRASGYMPTEERCKACTVESCPFSKYKEGNWRNELLELDPRQDMFAALYKRFEHEHPGYALRGFLCADIPDDEIWLSPNAHFVADEPFVFTAYASKSVVQSLLMHEIEPENWSDYAENFNFRISKCWDTKTVDVTTETIEKAFEGMDYAEDAKTEPEEVDEEKVPLKDRVLAFFKKIF